MANVLVAILIIFAVLAGWVWVQQHLCRLRGPSSGARTLPRERGRLLRAATAIASGPDLGDGVVLNSHPRYSTGDHYQLSRFGFPKAARSKGEPEP